MQFKSGNEGTVDSKHFLKLKDGESAVGVFRGDPYEFKEHWLNGRSTPCESNCEHCAAKNKPRFKFRLNFVMKDEKSTYTVRILDQGWQVYEQLKGLHEGDYPLDKTIVRISRKGSGPTDTSYTVLPVKNSELPQASEREIEKLTLHNLVTLGSDTQAAPPPSIDECPF